MKKIKSFLKKMLTCWKVLTGEITFEQRTVTFMDTCEKVRQLKTKYFPADSFIQFSITKQGSSTKDLAEYAMYSNLPYPNFVKSYSLEECFQKYESFLKQEKKEVVSDSVKVEI